MPKQKRYPRINGTPLDSAHREEMEAWEERIKALIEIDLDIVNEKLSERAIASMAYNIAFDIVSTRFKPHA